MSEGKQRRFVRPEKVLAEISMAQDTGASQLLQIIFERDAEIRKLREGIATLEHILEGMKKRQGRLK